MKTTPFEKAWLLSAALLTALSWSVRDQWLAESQAMIAFLVVSAVWVTVAVIVRRSLGDSVKGEIDFPIRGWIFFAGVGVLCLGSPVFENDHFRYLWEGRALIHGYNPYLQPPESIVDLAFAKKDQVAYPQLSSVYPPLALGLFAAVGWLPFSVGMMALSVLNGGLLWILLRWLWRKRNEGLYLVLLIPWFQKEFVQSVHVDLWAFCLMGFVAARGLNSLTALRGRPSFAWMTVGIVIGAFAKIVSVIYLPFALLFHRSRVRSWETLVSLLALVLMGVLAWQLMGQPSGTQAFTEYWIWSPGFYSLLDLSLGLDASWSRRLCVVAFGIYACCLYAYAWWCRNRFVETPGQQWQQWLFVLCSLVGAGLLFFSPVCNSWYFIWLAPFAWLAGQTFGIAYVVASFLAYLPHEYLHLSWIAELGVHVWFLATVYEGTGQLKAIREKGEL